MPRTQLIRGGGPESNSVRVTLASDSTGVMAVTDGGGSLTVDGAVGVSGPVAIDQSVPGTTNKVVTEIPAGGLAAGAVATGAIVDGADLTQGVTTGAAVATDAPGTIQQYLRGLVKLIAAKINIKIADGDDATKGITTGAAVVTDAQGTLQQYLRGIVKLIVDKPTVKIDQTTMGVSNLVVAQPYLYSISEGDIPGHTPFTKLGYNGNVGASEEDLIPDSTAYVFPVVQARVDVVSSSPKDMRRAILTMATSGGGADTLFTLASNHGLANADIVTISSTTNYNGQHVISSVAGATFIVIGLPFLGNDATGQCDGPGVSQIRLVYLDNAYAEHSEIITLLGTTVVTSLAATFYRVNTLRCVTTGASLVAVGTIKVTKTGTVTPIFRSLLPGQTRAREMVHTVPAGKTLYITSVTIGSAHTTPLKIVTWTLRMNYDDGVGPAKTPFWMPYFEMQTIDSSFYKSFEIPLIVPATVDMKMAVISNPATSICMGAIRGWIE
jgi:hypothetical protein